MAKKRASTSRKLPAQLASLGQEGKNRPIRYNERTDRVLATLKGFEMHDWIKRNFTDFSDFIRNATSEEKERVYMEVIDRAIARQLAKVPLIPEHGRAPSTESGQNEQRAVLATSKEY